MYVAGVTSHFYAYVLPLYHRNIWKTFTCHATVIAAWSSSPARVDYMPPATVARGRVCHCVLTAFYTDRPFETIRTTADHANPPLDTTLAADQLAAL